jgi:hypothetical protein
LAVTFPTTLVSAADQGDPLAIVVGKGSSLSNLSLFELKRVYLGDDLDDPSGTKILALNRGAQTLERTGFDRTVLGMSPEAAARYWIDRRIRGQSAAPKAVDPASLLQRVVSRLKGSVGYVRLQEVSNDVKVVTVDGRKPGDAGYPILTATSSSASGTASRWWS